MDKVGSSEEVEQRLLEEADVNAAKGALVSDGQSTLQQGQNW